MSVQQLGKFSDLLELNPQLSLSTNGIYQNTSTQIRDSQLSSYIQGAVNDSLDNAKDHSLHSVDLEKLLLTDELRAAFSAAPVNFLLSFDFSGVNCALDLTQGFGGATHFIADKVGAVDCLRIDTGHATLSAKRCSEFSNINYISEDLSLLRFPRKHYDLILISQLETLHLSKTEQISLFERLNNALSDSGRLVVSVKNRNRLNKWMSQGSDQIAYNDLYHTERDTNFCSQELEQALCDAGFCHSDIHASFSAPGTVQNLFSKAYLSNNPHALNHFNRLGGINNEHLNEYLLFRNMLSEGSDIFAKASRFLVICGASSENTLSLYDNDFTHFSGLGRKPQWRATTGCKRASDTVRKTLVHPALSHLPSEILQNNTNLTISLSQTTEPQRFQPGLLLLDKWLSALISPNPVDALKTQVSEYTRWLRSQESEPGFHARAYDLLPFNIIVDEQGRFNAIDPEWVINVEYDAEFIIFRALFWFAFENKTLLMPLARQSGASTIGLFVVKFMDSIEQLSQLSGYVEMEEIIQRQIGQSFRNKAVEYAMLQTFDGETPAQRLKPACQISWSDKAGIVDEHNSVFVSWKASKQDQTLNSETPLVAREKNVLRIDPISDMGIFNFSSIKLLSDDNTVLWELNSASEIAQASEMLNLAPAVDEQSYITHFIALNEDPHFLFSVEAIPNWHKARQIELSFALIHNQYYDNALSTLSHALSEQDVALGKQIGVLDTKQAEIEYLSARLANIDQHRQALQAAIHKSKIAHEEHSRALTEALNIQTERNKQLENTPFIKIVLRCKRIISRVKRMFVESN